VGKTPTAACILRKASLTAIFLRRMACAMADYLLGSIEDFPEGKGRAFRAGGRTIAVFRTNGKLYALANRCVHKGASLCDGEISENGTVLRCPWHNWPFDLATGEHKLDRSEKLRTYRVRLDGGQVILSA
jgi:nitrite reductase/ring-hydroxylating ferredoxin subunit